MAPNVYIMGIAKATPPRKVGCETNDPPPRNDSFKGYGLIIPDGISSGTRSATALAVTRFPERRRLQITFATCSLAHHATLNMLLKMYPTMLVRMNCIGFMMLVGMFHNTSSKNRTAINVTATTISFLNSYMNAVVVADFVKPGIHLPAHVFSQYLFVDTTLSIDCQLPCTYSEKRFTKVTGDARMSRNDVNKDGLISFKAN